jgi:hypothetical protein
LLGSQGLVGGLHVNIKKQKIEKIRTAAATIHVRM